MIFIAVTTQIVPDWVTYYICQWKLIDLNFYFLKSPRLKSSKVFSDKALQDTVPWCMSLIQVPENPMPMSNLFWRILCARKQNLCQFQSQHKNQTFHFPPQNCIRLYIFFLRPSLDKT